MGANANVGSLAALRTVRNESRRVSDARGSARSLTAFYLGETSDIYKLIVEQTDSLFLSKAQLDSAKATEKSYWKIFWVQLEIAAAIVTPSQRELLPFFKVMLSIPMKERENSQWSFGHPVTFADKSKPN